MHHHKLPISALSMLLFVCSNPLQAGLVFTCVEGGGEVTCASPGGALDLSGLVEQDTFNSTVGFVNASSNSFISGPTGFAEVTRFDSLHGPASIGSGPFTRAVSGTGGPFGISFRMILVPASYVSNEAIGPLSTTYASNLAALGINSGTHVWEWGTGAGQSITLIVPSASITGDFDLDGIFDCNDIDALVAEIVSGSDAASFDLTGDGLVNDDDQTEWLARAALANGLPGPYLLGDVNLDGNVDGSDFVAWNTNKFTSTAGWCSGDLNHDGVVDGADFVVWNGNKFTSSDQIVSAVPEATTGWSILCLIVCFRGYVRTNKSQWPAR
jgi:hypothetical protein